MALFDVQVGVLANQALNYLVSGKPPKRMGNAHPNVVPYQVFPTSDGHMIIAVGNDSQFRNFCDVLGLTEFKIDPRFTTNGDRNLNRGALIPALSERTRKRTRADLLAALEKVGVPAGPISDIAEVFADPQVKHRKMRVDLPEGAEGGVTIPGVRTPIHMSATPLRYDHPSPRLGEHTEEIRAALKAGHPAFRGEKK